MRIITLGYVFAGANIAFQGIFQAFGSGMRSLAVSVLRLIVITLPAAWLLTTFANAEAIVWWAFPIAEAVALGVALALMRGIARGRIGEL